MPASFDMQGVRVGIHHPQLSELPTHRFADVLKELGRGLGKARRFGQGAGHGKLGRQSPVRVLAGRYVANDSGIDVLVVFLVLAKRELKLDLLAALMYSVDLDDGGVVSSMPCLVGEFFVVGNDPVDRLSDHVRNTMSENPLSSAADGQDFSLFIDGEDRVICGFLDDFVALAQFFHTDLPASLLWSIPTLSNTPTK